MQYALDSTNFIPPSDVINSSPPGITQKYTGLLRYAGTPNLPWKNIDPTEQAIYNKARLPVSHVFEIGGGTALLGKSEGQRNANAMLADLDHCNANARAAHFVAQDEPYTINWKTPVANYFAGIHAECDPAKLVVSGYGGYYVIKFLFDEGLIKIGWQTKAWSYDPVTNKSLRDIRAAIYQQVGYVYPGGFKADWDILYSFNWGQNTYADIPNPKENTEMIVIKSTNRPSILITGDRLAGIADSATEAACIKASGLPASVLTNSEYDAFTALWNAKIGSPTKDLADTVDAVLATVNNLITLINSDTSELATAITTASSLEEQVLLSACLLYTSPIPRD